MLVTEGQLDAGVYGNVVVTSSTLQTLQTLQSFNYSPPDAYQQHGYHHKLEHYSAPVASSASGVPAQVGIISL